MDEPESADLDGLGEFEDAQLGELFDDEFDEHQQAQAAASSPVDEGGQLTRFQMLEFLNSRAWWREGQSRLSFTIVLWGIFGYLALHISQVESGFRVQDTLAGHIQTIVAHPSISAIQIRTPAESAMPCRCSCRQVGQSQNACDVDGEAEALRFSALLPAQEANRIVDMNKGAFPSGAQDMMPLKLENITSATDVWRWIQHGLLPDFWGSAGHQVTHRPGLVIGRNLVVGGVRIRQMRTPSSSANCKVISGIQSWYKVACHADKPATDTFGPAASTNQTVRNSVPVLAQSAYYQSASTSAAPGNFDAMFDIERPVSDSLTTATFLSRNSWLDASSESLSINTLLLNAEAGVYVLMHIKFDFGSDGTVHKNIATRLIRATSGRNSIADIWPQVAWLILLAMMLRQEIFQIAHMAYGGKLRSYFTDPWNIVDWVSIVVGVLMAVYSFWIDAQTSSLTQAVVQLPRAPLPANFNVNSYRDSWSRIIDDADFIALLNMYLQLCIFWYTSIITLRFLKGFLGQSKLAMLQITLFHGFWDGLHFLIVFTIVFNNFVASGQILFGAELPNWSSYSRAVSTSFAILMGSPKFDDMYEIAPINATIWYWLFILSLIFLLLNLLLVIIIDHFSIVRKAVGAVPTLTEDMQASLKELRWRLDWRKDQWSEGEYKLCFLGDPYAGLFDALMETANCDETFEEASEVSCLGLKLKRKRMEDASIEGLNAEDNPGCKNTSSLELRRCGCDAATAEHLLDDCATFTAGDTNGSLPQVAQVQRFVQLLRSHKQRLDDHCKAYEEGIVEDQSCLDTCIDQLEESIKAALEAFTELRTTGVDSLAPPLLGQGGHMKEQLPAAAMLAQPTLPALRSTGWSHRDFSPAQPAIGYHTLPALLN